MKSRIQSVVRTCFACALLLPAATTPAQENPAALTPFGEGVKTPARPALKPLSVKPIDLNALAPTVAGDWIAELPGDEAAKPFSIVADEGKPTLVIAADALVPARTTVRVLLPGDGPTNGDVWAKNRATHISFYCKSSAPAQMSFHLLQRGKTAGTYQAGFAVKPGDWQLVILPITQFNLKSFAKVAGVGFRSVSADKGTEVRVRDLRVGGETFTDDAWRSHRLSISLKGDWRFATEVGEQGIAGNWFADDFDDSSWKLIKSGLSWQEQGVDHHGFGWYRQRIFVPKELAGTPMTITLAKMPSDDDAWFNGVRIGGWRGEYKYDNHLVRAYTVPASAIRYGETNTIAIRVWGGHLSFIGDKSGLIAGPLVAEFDPYAALIREPGGAPVPAEVFDLSDAQRGKPFEVGFAFPAELAKVATTINCRVTDLAGNDIVVRDAPLTVDPDGHARAWVALDREAAHTAYLRGRLRANLTIHGAEGDVVYSGVRTLERLSFLKRDESPLPALAEQIDETPYGRLKLIDEIDAGNAVIDDAHPYLQSGFDHSQNRMTPGSAVDVRVAETLGRKARESGFGWFAYRVGRGKLKPRATYLMRIEYPEDKPRYAALEIQTGQNFMDVGWKNGLGADDVYDNWPLSKQWQWYDVIVPLDDETTGTGGTGTAPAENGVWVYFMNKIKPNAYFSLYSGGPAVGRIRLYEIDPQQHAPVIRKPQGLPQRVLSFDWERQPDHEPADLVKYAKLMGYNAISPVIIKWAFANYSEPLNGYTTVNIDDRSYWSQEVYDPKAGKPAAAPLKDKASEHVRYLAATKEYGIDYIPRFEWGGSMDLPQEAWAIGEDGKPQKPNRFAQWCTNLLHPAAWDDLQKLMDHLIKPYVKDNPQLVGALWRIRSNRVPISYGRADIELFAKETNTKLPPGGPAQLTAWAAGEKKSAYDDWWHGKRAAFHARLVELLRSYRPDFTLYYYNWDEDKFGLINTDLNGWNFLATLGSDGPAVYRKEREARKAFTAADYISVLHTGNFGDASKGINRADYGIRPQLYKDVKGFQPFAPANYLCYANMPDYLNYFRTADGVAVSNVVSYDEIASRSINPKYEGNMITPAGPEFSMALEVLSYFHTDARTLNYTVYTYGRGFADAHRRFAQAYLALPAIEGQEIPQKDPDVKVRLYKSEQGTYVGVAYKGYERRTLAIDLPVSGTITDLVSGKDQAAGGLKIDSAPMQLHAYLIK